MKENLNTGSEDGFEKSGSCFAGYISGMVKDVFNQTKDKDWLASQLPSVEAEYRYWMSERITDVGLNHYAHAATGEYLTAFAKDILNTRIKKNVPESDLENFGANLLAEAESGWDFTPRFDFECSDYFPIDLNCIMYKNERDISAFYECLGKYEKAKKYQQYADTRKDLINRYCYDKESAQYRDYSYKKAQFSPLLTCASFFPYYVGVCSDTKRLLELTDLLECPYGIATCQKNDSPFVLQWDYPNMWSNLMFYAIESLYLNGLDERADAIKNRFMDVVEREYHRTGNLWEKYDAVTGKIAEHNEYELTDMLGWTAGVYFFYCKNHLKANRNS